MVRSILGACRLPSDDTHRFQLVRQVVNNNIDYVLSHRVDWPFMNRTAEILSESGENRYALPFDFAHHNLIGFDGEKCEVYSPDESYRYPGNGDGDQDFLACTIEQIMSSPYAAKGYVFPTYGSKTISGVGASFTPEMVGRFFKSDRDGEIYRVSRYVNADEVELDQEYGGRSQAGRVSVYDSNLKIVYGNPHITNFTEDMQGLLINIEGNASPIQIASVDVNNQKITLEGDSAAGEGLIFSIQDAYQIDPPGSYILNFENNISENDKVIAVKYYAFQPSLVGPYDTPYLIPVRFHQVILYHAIVEYALLDEEANTKVAMFESRASKGLANMLNNSDPLEPGYKYGSEPDRVRLSRTDIAR